MPDEEKVVVCRSNHAKKYHKPADGDRTMPKCKVERQYGHDEDKYTLWSIEKADAWREKCQKAECWGDESAEWAGNSRPEVAND